MRGCRSWNGVQVLVAKVPVDNILVFKKLLLKGEQDILSTGKR